MWRDHPIFGIGFGAFRTSCPNYTQLGTYCTIHSHNTYLQWLAETGLVGLLGFLVLLYLIGTSFYTGWKTRSGDLQRDHSVGSLNLIGSVPNWRYGMALGFVLALNHFLWPIMATMGFFSNWNASLFWWNLGISLALVVPKGIDPIFRKSEMNA